MCWGALNVPLKTMSVDSHFCTCQRVCLRSWCVMGVPACVWLWVHVLAGYSCCVSKGPGRFGLYLQPVLGPVHDQHMLAVKHRWVLVHAEKALYACVTLACGILSLRVVTQWPGTLQVPDIMWSLFTRASCTLLGVVLYRSIPLLQPHAVKQGMNCAFESQFATCR